MSTDLSGAALDVDLQKYLLVLKRRWLPAALVFAAVTALATAYAVTREPSYQATGKILVKVDRTPSLAGLDVPGRTSIGEPDTVGLESDLIATEVESIRSLSIAETTIKDLNLETDEGEPIGPDNFFKALEVKPIPGTDLIRISFTSNDPEKAAIVVNKVIDVYRDSRSATKREEATVAKEFIAQQLPEVESQVRNAESDLREFREENQVISLGEESLQAVRTIEQLELQIAQAQAQLSTATARSNDIQQRLGINTTQALQAASLSQSPAIQEAFTQIRDTQSQLDIARSQYRPTHPTVIGLERQEALMRERLESRIAQAVGSDSGIQARGLQLGVLEQELLANLLQSEIERVGLVSQVNQLIQAQANQRSRANVIPRLESAQRELERRLAAAQSTYEALLQSLQDIQVAQNQPIDNIRVVSAAITPINPISSKKLIVLAGMMVGGVLGLITAFALDLADGSVKSVREAQELLDLPLLGVIPQSSGNLPLVNGHLDSSGGTSMTKAYRMLESNLKFISPPVESEVFVVTSAVNQEGRSTIAAGIALTSGQAGNNVLLIDADTQRPNQHNIWNCRSDKGLSDFLDGTAAIEDIIYEVAPNVFLLPLGDKPLQSLSSYNPERIISFIKDIKQRFDVSIIDTAPLTQSSDASSLGTLTDGTIVVVRPGHVKAVDVRAAHSFLRLSGQKTLGIVVNGVKQVRNPNQYFVNDPDIARLASAEQHKPAYPENRLPDSKGQPSYEQKDNSQVLNR